MSSLVKDYEDAVIKMCVRLHTVREMTDFM